MLFPWVGMFEQIRLADVFVNYGDVQFSKGGFSNRVQIKTARGIKWMTVPLQEFFLGQSIDEVRVHSVIDWRGQHLDMLRQAYVGAPYLGQMLALVESVYGQPLDTVGELSRRSMEVCCEYFGLYAGRKFIDVGELGIGGAGSPRVLEIVKALGGTRYVTGWGARNYLDHEAFDNASIRVEYMDYQKVPYPQLHGEFTPFVTILDLVANVGKAGLDNIRSGTVFWKGFLEHERD
jgi:hypothetical protein